MKCPTPGDNAVVQIPTPKGGLIGELSLIVWIYEVLRGQIAIWRQHKEVLNTVRDTTEKFSYVLQTPSPRGQF